MTRSPSVATGRMSFDRSLKELSMFFAGKDEVHKAARRLVTRLDRARISYALVGAMALNAHHYRRATTDVDILLTAAGFEEFQRRYLPKNYQRVSGRRRRFTDRSNGVMIDVLLTGLYPGTGQPGPIAYPDPAEVSVIMGRTRVVDLPTLVQLKLAARRWKDFADVVELIRVNGLDESFAQGLHTSVRQDYIECLEEKRREDEYELG